MAALQGSAGVPAESPPAPKFAVILGAPRSGTTWLQRVLAAHPSIATPQETHLLDLYLAPLYARWWRQSRRIAENLASIRKGQDRADRLFGLPTILRDQDIDAAAALLLDAVINRTVAAARDADGGSGAIEWVIEKTPSNALHVDLLDRLAPQCRYLHIIRDPREVAASMIATSKQWGPTWAPRTAATAAGMWREHVEKAREARRFGERYLEIRYEDLRADAAKQVARVLEFLDLPGADSEQLATKHGEFTFSPQIREQIGAETYEPPTFSGGGRVRHGLSRNQQIIVEHQTRALRAELGYGATERWPASSVVQQAGVLPVAGAVAATRRAARRQLLRMVGNRATRQQI